MPLLGRAPGFADVDDDHRHYRALVVDRPEGRVVALTDLAPYRAGLTRLLSALALAELAGVLASIAVVVLFTRRSVQPLAQALALQRRFVADASHELRAPLTVLHTRAQMLRRRIELGTCQAPAGTPRRWWPTPRSSVGCRRSAGVGDSGGGKREANRVDLAGVAESVCASLGARRDSGSDAGLRPRRWCGRGHRFRGFAAQSPDSIGGQRVGS